MSDEDLIQLAREASPDADLIDTCPTCEGTGIVVDHACLCNVQCPDCEGRGFTEV